MAAADDRAGRPLPFCDVFHALPFRRNPFSPCNLRPYLALKRLLAREHFDIIHCHTLTGGILARLAARKSRKHGTKVIYTAHGFAFYRGAPLWRRVFGLSESLCARWTDVLITINREDTRFAARALHPRRAEYVPGVGVDITRYAHKESLREKTRSALGLSENTLMLLSVGRLDRNKNQKTMLRVLSALQKEHPDIRFHISSGNSVYVMEQLDRGLIDFGILYDSQNLSKYDSVKIPDKDIWGVLMRRDSPLAQKDYIEPQDLWDKPLILSRQAAKGSLLADWMQKDFSKLTIAATYNLLFNGSLMVDEGVGYAVCLDKIINTSDTNLCFHPLKPRIEAEAYLVWKKYQIFPKAAGIFLERLQKALA